MTSQGRWRGEKWWSFSVAQVPAVPRFWKQSLVKRKDTPRWKGRFLMADLAPIKSRKRIAIKSFIIKVALQAIVSESRKRHPLRYLDGQTNSSFCDESKDTERVTGTDVSTPIPQYLSRYPLHHLRDKTYGQHTCWQWSNLPLYVDLCSLSTEFLVERKRECRLPRQWSHAELLGAGITRREVSTHLPLWNIAVVFDCWPISRRLQPSSRYIRPARISTRYVRSRLFWSSYLTRSWLSKKEGAFISVPDSEQNSTLKN